MKSAILALILMIVAPASFFDFKLNAIDGKVIDFDQFKGKTLLIVNTASQCGYTPQYAPLEAVYEQYRAHGLTIIAFPSPDFGGQEYGTAAEVTTKCTDSYRISFPLFAIGPVKNPSPQPVYAWVHAQPGSATIPPPDPGLPAAGYDRDVQWNFEKYLIDRKGKIVLRVENGTYPDAPEVIAAIAAELAKK